MQHPAGSKCACWAPAWRGGQRASGVGAPVSMGFASAAGCGADDGAPLLLLSMSGATKGFEGGTRSWSMVCAKKQTRRRHLGPSLHSWLR